MAAVLWLFIVLVFIPTALYGTGAGIEVLVYLFALNLLAGYMFWTRKGFRGLGRKSMALIYLASGICFFAFLVDPVRIDTTVTDLDSLSDWQRALGAKTAERPMLAGNPVEQMSVKRQNGTSERPWLTGLIEDVVRSPEEPRQVIRGEARN